VPVTLFHRTVFLLAKSRRHGMALGIPT
jgi:hypothetical protein